MLSLTRRLPPPFATVADTSFQHDLDANDVHIDLCVPTYRNSQPQIVRRL